MILFETFSKILTLIVCYLKKIIIIAVNLHLMKKNWIYILLLSITITYNSKAQVVMSQRAQYSQLATPEDKQLFLVEFWATWCAPCIHVSKYLNILQEKYASDFYVVSLSQENPEVVKRFLQTHTTKLAVSIDYDGQNFKKYNVHALPYGVLLNANGDILWRGNPANLKNKDIEYFLKRNTQKIPIYDFLKYKSYEIEQPNTLNINGDYTLNPSDTEIGQIALIEQSSENLITIEGSLQQILAYLLGVSQSQVYIDEQTNTAYRLICNQNADKKNILHNIQQQLKITPIRSEKVGQILELQLLSSEKLWDTNQIQWGFPNSKYLVDDHQITIDNMSVSEFIALISEFYQHPIKLIQNTDNQTFDWQIHYKFVNLLIQNLNEYGFETQEKQDKYPVFRFTSH